MVLTKSISRFARNTVTLLQTVREFKALGVDVYFEEQNIHTMSGEGELMMTILASYAQEESRSASENHHPLGRYHAKERMDQQPGERRISHRGIEELIVMGFLAEVEVPRQRVLEIVHDEIAEQDQERRLRRGQMQGFGDHGGYRRGQHEPRAKGNKVGK